MSKKIVYGCSKCDCVGIFHERDGTSCPDCGGFMFAIREAEQGEFVGVQRYVKKVAANIDQKLSYLDRLITIAHLNDVYKHIAAVCNSVEQDLGIKPADYDVMPKSGIVGTKADIDELIEKIKGEPLRVIKVGGTIDISQGYTGGIFDIDDIGKQSDE